MARSGLDFPERMEFGRARVSEQPVPRPGPYSHHAREASFKIAKINRAYQRRKVCAEGSHGGAVIRARIYRHDEEDRSACERRRYGLWNRSRFNRGVWSHGNRNSIVRHLASGTRLNSGNSSCANRLRTRLQNLVARYASAAVLPERGLFRVREKMTTSEIVNKHRREARTHTGTT